MECLAWASTLWSGGVGIRFASRPPSRLGRRPVGDPAGAFLGLAWQCHESHGNHEEHTCHEAHEPENVVVHPSLSFEVASEYGHGRSHDAHHEPDALQP